MKRRRHVPAASPLAPSPAAATQVCAPTANPSPSPETSSAASVKKRKKTFLLRAKTFFLTYPMCEMDKEEALRQLQEKLPGISEWIVAQEEHQSGDHHLHVYLKMEGRPSVTAADFLDLMGPEGQRFHGDYRSCRSPKSVQRYCTNEGNYISNMDLTEEKKEIWKPARALAKEGKLKEAMDLLEMLS